MLDGYYILNLIKKSMTMPNVCCIDYPSFSLVNTLSSMHSKQVDTNLPSFHILCELFCCDLVVFSVLLEIVIDTFWVLTLTKNLDNDVL